MGELEGKILTCPVQSKILFTNGKVFSPPARPLDRPEIENLNLFFERRNGEINIKIWLSYKNKD
jgi:hypothetical protein